MDAPEERSAVVPKSVGVWSALFVDAPQESLVGFLAGRYRRRVSSTAVAGAPFQRRPSIGAAFLFGAALCWGFGFYGQRLSIEELLPLTATAARFTVSLPIMVAAIWWRRRRGHRIPWRAGILLGVLLYAAFALQTVGMVTAPVTRVALLTGLYAVFTPIFQPFFGLGRPRAIQVVATVIALGGTALLCGLVQDVGAATQPATIGDAMCLGMALISAVIVLLVGRHAPTEDPIALNAVQMSTMWVVSVVAAPIGEWGAWSALSTASSTTWWSLLFLAVFSTTIAFTCQIFGQRHLSPAPAAVIMLLEAPIGVLAAVLFLGETMGPWQWVGGGVVVVAVLLSVLSEPSTPGPAIEAAAA